MEINDSIITYVATTFYDLILCEHKIHQLEGYSDRNFAIEENHGNKFVVKIINEEDSNQELVSIIDEILDDAYAFFDACKTNVLLKTPRLIKTSSNRLSVTCKLRVCIKAIDTDQECNVKLFQFVDSTTVNDLLKRKHANRSDFWPIYKDLGIIGQRVNSFMRTQQHLVDRLKRVRASYPWQLMTCRNSIEVLREQLFPNEIWLNRRQLVDKVLLDWIERLEPGLSKLPEYVLHGDLNTKNVLIQEEDRTYWLIDFQDVQVGPRVVDLAIMLLYAILESEWLEFEIALEKIPSLLLKGYQEQANEPLNELEMDLLSGLMRFRLCQSMLNGLRAFELDPGNKNLLSTNLRGWDLLEMLFAKEIELKRAFRKIFSK